MKWVGAYFVGSIALGGYVAGESDIDMVAVAERPTRDELKHEIAEVLFDATLHCPARGDDRALEHSILQESDAGPRAGQQVSHRGKYYWDDQPCGHDRTR